MGWKAGYTDIARIVYIPPGYVGICRIAIDPAGSRMTLCSVTYDIVA